MIRLSPAVGYAARSIGGWRSKHWREIAVDNWEVAPAEARENPAPLCIPGRLDKARSIDHGWRVNNLRNLFSPTIAHKPTTAHLVKDVDLVGPALFSGRMRHRLSERRPAILDREPVEQIRSSLKLRPFLFVGRE